MLRLIYLYWLLHTVYLNCRIFRNLPNNNFIANNIKYVYKYVFIYFALLNNLQILKYLLWYFYDCIMYLRIFVFMYLRIFVFIWCAKLIAYTHLWKRIQHYITTWSWDFIDRSIFTLWGVWIKVIIDSRLSARKTSPTSVRQNEGLLSCVYKYGLTLFPTTFEWPRRNPHWGATIVCANFLSLSLFLSFDVAPSCPPLKLRFSVSTSGWWIALLASSYELIAVLRVWNIARRFRQLPRITRSSCLERI